jgi:transcriptional regulator with GAF, ATPase, and Fis domain/pSer/pThr/pTyr-binding forkhead associated (FHA) protein
VDTAEHREGGHNGCLVIRDPLAGRSVFWLPVGERISLGRAPGNQIVIRDERASRNHAEIMPSARGWMVRDLGSRNGTYLGSEPLTTDHLLAPGDVLSVGGVELVYHEGEPPPESTGSGSLSGTSLGETATAIDQWQASITHRRAKSRLLEELRTSAETIPRVGRAAAELCRLSFSLGRAESLADVGRLAVETAVEGIPGARGVVLLPAALDPAVIVDLDALTVTAALPDPWPDEPPWAAVETVLATDEALMATPSVGDGSMLTTISAPIRSGGRPVGVLHLAIDGHHDRPLASGGQAPGPSAVTTDDLEFAMAVCDAVGVAIENLSARSELSSKLASAADENAWLKQRLGEESRMVGASPQLAAIHEQIRRVAVTKATVLVRGESGAGKELVARAIHDASDRAGKPFICLNCAALSETLLESELFGHEKGAFTGATERKAGKFEAAHGGTLVLDEIGEMSPAIQAKFLRVLEGHPFERVGGSRRINVDVRVVAATNRNLEEAVASGDFRRDLYFRLRVVEILVPPLRKRREDIEPLADHFLTRFARETGRKVRGFTAEALEALRNYDWPGNIREMRNVIERAVVLSQGDLIDRPELALSQLPTPGDTGRGKSARDSVGREAGSAPAYRPESLDEVERRHVFATIEAAGGNKTKAASILGIERSTLDRKLTRWAKRQPGTS